MDNIQGALTDLLATIVTGCITLVSVYITFFINKTIENLKSKTEKIECELQRELINNAIERTSELVYLNVVKAEQTLVKEIIEKSEDGKIDKEELKEVSVIVRDEVISQMGIEVIGLLQLEIQDIKGYVSALIEKTLAELKGQIK